MLSVADGVSQREPPVERPGVHGEEAKGPREVPECAREAPRAVAGAARRNVPHRPDRKPPSLPFPLLFPPLSLSHQSQELSVWRKQATISVQEEFEGRALPPTLEDSLPPTLEELFSRSRLGIRRSAELYTAVCAVMDRLVKRTEGVAADHGRIALSLASLTEASADTYATDASEVPLVNDGLAALSRRLRTGQALLEDESRAWEAGVLEDLKRQRDGLVSVRDMFDRRERLDRDSIAQLERRIEANEGRLAGLRGREGVRPGEVEKVAEAIIKVSLARLFSCHFRLYFYLHRPFGFITPHRTPYIPRPNLHKLPIPPLPSTSPSPGAELTGQPNRTKKASSASTTAPSS